MLKLPVIKGPQKWITDFLKDRSQYVSVSGSTSSKTPVSGGVPLGSVLGPVPFIYFINNMHDFISSVMKLFADDNKPIMILEQLVINPCFNNLSMI